MLISREFFYFGESEVQVPRKYTPMLARTQGYKNCHDEELIDGFWSWVMGQARSFGRHGEPIDFNDPDCMPIVPDDD